MANLANLRTLRDIFPQWTESELQDILDETQGDLELAISRITEGHAEQFQVKARKPKKKEAAPARGRGRGRGRGGSRAGAGRPVDQSWGSKAWDGEWDNSKVAGWDELESETQKLDISDKVTKPKYFVTKKESRTVERVEPSDIKPAKPVESKPEIPVNAKPSWASLVKKQDPPKQEVQKTKESKPIAVPESTQPEASAPTKVAVEKEKKPEQPKTLPHPLPEISPEPTSLPPGLKNQKNISPKKKQDAPVRKSEAPVIMPQNSDLKNEGLEFGSFSANAPIDAFQGSPPKPASQPQHARIPSGGVPNNVPPTRTAHNVPEQLNHHYVPPVMNAPHAMPHYFQPHPSANYGMQSMSNAEFNVMAEQARAYYSDPSNYQQDYSHQKYSSEAPNSQQSSSNNHAPIQPAGNQGYPIYGYYPPYFMPNQFQHGYQNPMYQQNQVPGKSFQGFQAQNTSASHPNSSAPAISSKSQVNPTANLTTPPEANPHSSYAFYQNPGNYGGQQAQGPVEYSKMYGAPENGFGQKPFQKQQKQQRRQFENFQQQPGNYQQQPGNYQQQPGSSQLNQPPNHQDPQYYNQYGGGYQQYSGNPNSYSRQHWNGNQQD